MSLVSKYRRKTLSKFKSLFLFFVVLLILLILYPQISKKISAVIEYQFYIGSISGENYYLFKDQYNLAYLFNHYHSDRGKVWDLAFTNNADRIKSVWYDQEKNRLIILKTTSEKTPSGIEMIIYKPITIFGKTIGLGEKIKLKDLKEINDVYILGIDNQASNIFLETMNRDECGGTGYISLVNTITKKITIIETIGKGECASYSYPRFVGYKDGDLYFALYNDEEIVNSPFPLHGAEKSTIKSIYKQSIKTGEIQEVLDESAIPDNITEADIDFENKNTLNLLNQVNHYFYRYDLEGKYFFIPD